MYFKFLRHIKPYTPNTEVHLDMTRSVLTGSYKQINVK